MRTLITIIASLLFFVSHTAPVVAFTGAYWQVPPPVFAICGLRIDELPTESYDATTGTYETSWRMRNTTDAPITVDARRFDCRCPENDGNWPETGWSTEDTSLPPSPACVGQWPNAGSCIPRDEQFTLQAGEETTRTIALGTDSAAADKNCGSFQIDYSILAVNGDQSCVGHPFAWGYQYSKLHGGETCVREGEPTPDPPPVSTERFYKCDERNQCVARYTDTAERSCDPNTPNDCFPAAPPPETGTPPRGGGSDRPYVAIDTRGSTVVRALISVYTCT